MYVYTAAGIVSFVIIVIIISVISMHGCKGKTFRCIIHNKRLQLSEMRYHQLILKAVTKFTKMSSCRETKEGDSNR